LESYFWFYHRYSHICLHHLFHRQISSSNSYFVGSSNSPAYRIIFKTSSYLFVSSSFTWSIFSFQVEDVSLFASINIRFWYTHQKCI
jgi:hypothetical protein